MWSPQPLDHQGNCQVIVLYPKDLQVEALNLAPTVAMFVILSLSEDLLKLHNFSQDV